MPTSAFICYRRGDTAAAAGRVYDRLGRLLSKSNVFFDVTTVGGGENFEASIDAAMQRIDCVLIFIGQKWLEPDGDGQPRLWDDRDYVRAEIRAALGRERKVVPILVDGASMPKADALPEDIRALATRNALPLRHESFDDDAEAILAAILGAPAKERPWDRKARLLTRLMYAGLGLVLGLAAMILIALLHQWVWERPLAATIGDAATTLLLIASAAVGAVAGLVYEARRRGVVQAG